MNSIEIHNIDSIRYEHRSDHTVFQIEIFHEQLPLPVPCYDLLPVIELTVGLAKARTSGIPNSLELTGGEYKT